MTGAEMIEIEHKFRPDQAATTLQPYLNPLPRSVIRNNTFVLLDGEWRFDLDPEDRGLRERWHLQHTYSGTTNWPSSIEAHMAEMQGNGNLMARKDEVIAWYERDFEVPQEWLTATSEVQVTFGACGYETRVWLNGRALSTIEGEKVHLGKYTSFSYELPRECLGPVNRLTVRVADTLDPDIPRGKQESHVYKRGGIWYQTISGPVRSIWIEPIDRNRLRSRLGIISIIEERLVEFELTTSIRDPGLYRLRIVVSEVGDDQPLAIKEVEVPLELGEHRYHLAFELPGAKLWSASTPALYQMVAQILCPSGHVSQIEARFGLRNIEARGKWIYLNNERIYLNGILYQPATATFEEMRRHVFAVKELGCNLLRVHIAGIDPRIYELADELGMLVWVEVPSPHRSNPRSRAEHWAELQRLLVHIGSHPSVIILSLYNEDWGAQDIATNEETRTYILHACAYLRLRYPQLLIVDNDGWQHVSIEGRLGSHLLTAHLYQTDIDRWREVLDRLEAGDIENVAVLPLVIGDPFFYGGQVPILVSEWGGFGFSLYGGPEELESRSDRIRAFKRELVSRSIAGDVYTQATSIEEETNGLLDPHTGELFVPPGLLSSGSIE
jgi:hypothetical protein